MMKKIIWLHEQWPMVNRYIAGILSNETFKINDFLNIVIVAQMVTTFAQLQFFLERDTPLNPRVFVLLLKHVVAC